MTDEEVDVRIDYLKLPGERVHPRDINNAIKNIQYHMFSDTTVIVCCITLQNGYAVTGEAACADPRNFDPEIGRQIAFNNAKNKIWSLLGYVLRSELIEREKDVDTK